MKRAFYIFLTVLFVLSLAGCGGSKPLETTTATEAAAPTSAPTEAPTETPTEATAAESMPSATEATSAAPVNSHWNEQFYVDEFNDPTDESYIRGIFYGTFSNSLFSGRDLEVIFFMDKDLSGSSVDMFSIRLLEYGNNKISAYGIDGDDIEIKVKVDKTVYEDTAYAILDGDIYLRRGSRVFSPILKALDAGKEISVLINISSRTSTDTYRVTIDANGLSQIPHKWVA